MGIALLVLGYFAGSIPFGLVIARAVTGKDVRLEGSGNIGATNVARVVGKKLGVLVLVLDAAKGALPVLLAMWLLPGEPLWHAGVGGLAFLGHVFPVWLKFKGGKGVATALGVLCVLLPWAALSGFVVYAVLLALFRVSSVGSLAGGLTAVVVGFVLDRPVEYRVLAGALLLAMIFTHRGNIARLVQRTENKV